MRKSSQLTALLFHVEQVTACYGRGNDTVKYSRENGWHGMPGKVGLLRCGGGGESGDIAGTFRETEQKAEHMVQVY